MNYNVEQHKGPVQWPVTAAYLAFPVKRPLIPWLQVVLVLNIQCISLLATIIESDVRKEEDMSGKGKQLSNPC